MSSEDSIEAMKEAIEANLAKRGARVAYWGDETSIRKIYNDLPEAAKPAAVDDSEPHDHTVRCEPQEGESEPMCPNVKIDNTLCLMCMRFHGDRPCAAKPQDEPKRPDVTGFAARPFSYGQQAETYMDYLEGRVRELEAKLMKQAAKMGVLQFRAETAEKAANHD